VCNLAGTSRFVAQWTYLYEVLPQPTAGCKPNMTATNCFEFMHVHLSMSLSVFLPHPSNRHMVNLMTT
jgi:hypothetical protein